MQSIVKVYKIINLCMPFCISYFKRLMHIIVKLLLYNSYRPLNSLKSELDYIHYTVLMLKDKHSISYSFFRPEKHKCNSTAYLAVWAKWKGLTPLVIVTTLLIFFCVQTVSRTPKPINRKTDLDFQFKWNIKIHKPDLLFCQVKW